MGEESMSALADQGKYKTCGHDEATTPKMPGHWVLAKMGKRVLRPGGLQLTHQLLNELRSEPPTMSSNSHQDSGLQQGLHLRGNQQATSLSSATRLPRKLCEVTCWHRRSVALPVQPKRLVSQRRVRVSSMVKRCSQCNRRLRKSA